MYTHIFDSHAHYDDEMFDKDRDSLLSEFPSRGVSGIINCGTNAENSRKCVRLAKKYGYVRAACGIHPNDATEIKSGDFAVVTDLLKEPECVAVGEIGLDYHYNSVPRETQIGIFEKQIKIAVYLGLPVIVHDREAHGDTLAILKKYRPEGVLHCFSGSPEMAEEILGLGMYIGLGGAVTFKNAKKPLEVAAIVPDNRLLLETDCPYMTPEPFRGKRNDSSYIPYAAEKIAEVKGLRPQYLLRLTEENAKRLFRIK